MAIKLGAQGCVRICRQVSGNYFSFPDLIFLDLIIPGPMIFNISRQVIMPTGLPSSLITGMQEILLLLKNNNKPKADIIINRFICYFPPNYIKLFVLFYSR